MSVNLLEKWEPLIETEKAPKVSSKETMAQLLENQEEYLTEAASQAADLAQYTPILVPAVRRIFPNLVANEIVGVQALKTPTAYAYALRYSYAGNNANPAAGINNAAGSRGTFNRDLSGAPATWDTIAVLASNPNFVFGANIVEVGGTTVAGTVVYQEPGKALVRLANPAHAALFVSGASGALSDNSTFTVVASFNNEAGYNLIFKNYSGPMSTAAGETLTDIKSMKMTLERVQVEAKTRKLKAEYTLELAQDLKNVHGIDAEAELINILEYEIGAELDRELVDLINSKATVVAPWSYGSVGANSAGADGRWEAEKLRTLYTKILREANQVALQTRRGSANFIIASSNVVAALETLSGFMYASVPGTVKPTLGIAKVGTLDGRFTVYLDTFATEDYVTLGYKGNSAFDTGVIYCPYVPLQITKVTDPQTFQPKIGFMTRDAICGNLYGVEKYYRTFKVDFTNSQFGGPVWDGGAYYPIG